MTDSSLSYKYDFAAGKPTILFIHGFMGSSADWQHITSQFGGSYSCLAIDLPGHGKSLLDREEFYSFHFVNKSINSILDFLRIDSVILCGYSMGGRVALNYATKYPEKVSRLLLESTSAGLKNLKERKEREKFDLQMVEKLENIPFSKFLVEWYQLPLFNSLRDNHRHYDMIESKKTNSPKHLALALKKMGTGAMESMWYKLSYINMPTCIIHGEYDGKYSKISHAMQELIPDSCIHSVTNSGHIPHVENSHAFMNVMRNFLERS